MKRTRNLVVLAVAFVAFVVLTGCSGISSIGQPKFAVGDCVVTSASYTHGSDIKKVSCTSPGTTFFYQVASVHAGSSSCSYGYTTFVDERTDRTYCLAQKYGSAATTSRYPTSVPSPAPTPVPLRDVCGELKWCGD